MDIQGTVDPAFAPVRDGLAGILAAEAGAGAAIAVWHDGRRVIDLWGGYTGAGRDRLWQADSMAQPYSVSKPFAAVCALRLAETGRLELDAPMQRYWPELQARTTVREVLSHQAGLVVLTEPAPTEVFYDWDRLCGLLAAQEPAWEPGTAHGESPLFYGHLVGELVRRIDGRSLGRFLREEICGPAGLDFHFGLDRAQQARVVDVTGLGPEFQRANAAGRPELYHQAVANPPGTQDSAVINSSAWRAAEVPAINGHGTARAVADFYHALTAGRLLSPGMLAEAVTPQATGQDQVFGHDNSWGLGFAVEDDGFGMGGLGGSYGGACTDGGYTIGFVSGSAGDHDRLIVLENILRDCIGLPPYED